MVSRSTSCSCHIHTNARRRKRIDPSGTAGIRRAWAAGMRKRFQKVRSAVWQAVANEDILGLKETDMHTLAKKPQPLRFKRDSEKVGEFMDWLREMDDEEILGIQPGTRMAVTGEAAWQNVHIDSAYKQGMRFSAQNLEKAGIAAGQAGDALQAAFMQPMHADRVGLLYTRAFGELKGITDRMEQKVSRVLAEGMAQGMSPHTTARHLVKEIGLEENYARTLARTETIRAHHSANMNVLKSAGVEKVKVKAEWLATDDDRLCPDCAWMNGAVFSLKEMERLIPLHANCRCVAIPADVGEKKSSRGKRLKPGKNYQRKDGTAPKPRGYYTDITGKPMSSVTKKRKQ